MSRKVIAEHQVSTRKILGTDWPVVNSVVRQQSVPHKKPIWIVNVGCCNGTCEFAYEYPTKRAAMAEYEARRVSPTIVERGALPLQESLPQDERPVR